MDRVACSAAGGVYVYKNGAVINCMIAGNTATNGGAGWMDSAAGPIWAVTNIYPCSQFTLSINPLKKYPG